MSNQEYPKIPFAPPPYSDLETDILAAVKLGIIPNQVASIFKIPTAKVREILDRAKKARSND